MKKNIEQLLALAGHVIAGTLLFVIIAIPAIALNVVIKLLEPLNIDGFVMSALVFTEYAILIIDIVLLLGWIISSSYKALRSISNE